VSQVFTMFGAQQAIRHLKNHREAAAAAVERAVPEAAEILLEESNKLCPVDTGRLKESGTIVIQGKGLNTRAWVVYDTPYAIFVHENLEVFHEPPTQAKFLEEAVRRYKRDIHKFIRKEVQDATKRSKYWKGVSSRASKISKRTGVGVSNFSKRIAKRATRFMRRYGKRFTKKYLRVKKSGLKQAAKKTHKVWRKIGRVLKEIIDD